MSTSDGWKVCCIISHCYSKTWLLWIWFSSMKENNLLSWSSEKQLCEAILYWVSQNMEPCDGPNSNSVDAQLFLLRKVHTLQCIWEILVSNTCWLLRLLYRVHQTPDCVYLCLFTFVFTIPVGEDMPFTIGICNRYSCSISNVKVITVDFYSMFIIFLHYTFSTLGICY
jgi:hypothetical protein